MVSKTKISSSVLVSPIPTIVFSCRWIIFKEDLGLEVLLVVIPFIRGEAY